MASYIETSRKQLAEGYVFATKALEEAAIDDTRDGSVYNLL